MRKKITLLLVLITFLTTLAVGCGSTKAETGTAIINAKASMDLLGKAKVVFVDMQTPEGYSEGHVKGAVNIGLNNIVVNVPYPNMLPPKSQIEDILGKNGISNDTTVIVYDNNNNMEAARFWWTLRLYGHEKVKVVSGGIKALTEIKADINSDSVNPTPVTYTAKEADSTMLATLAQVKDQVNDPKKNVLLLDTRTQGEFDEGTIPGSILFDYSNNNYKDGTYKSNQTIQIQYIENKITKDKTIIMYCKTSVRGAQTYLALYNAGYRNLKLYDGAWSEWSANKSLPIQKPDTKSPVNSDNNDNS